MATIEEYAAQIKTAQDESDAKIAAIKADIDVLMAKVAAIPVAGMTPEQEALLAGVAAHAKSISDSLSAVDALNP